MAADAQTRTTTATARESRLFRTAVDNALVGAVATLVVCIELEFTRAWWSWACAILSLAVFLASYSAVRPLGDVVPGPLRGYYTNQAALMFDCLWAGTMVAGACYAIFCLLRWVLLQYLTICIYCSYATLFPNATCPSPHQWAAEWICPKLI